MWSWESCGLGELSGLYAPFSILDLPKAVELGDLTRIAQVRGASVTFVAAEPKSRRKKRRKKAPPSTALSYEERVFQRGEVSTRPGSWHDFFNALAWAVFPRTKAALNARQCALSGQTTAEQRARGIVRVREQDRLAMLDEGGAVRLRCGDRDESFVIGHAIHENRALGRTLDVTLFTVTIGVDAGYAQLPYEERLNVADALLAALVQAGTLAESDAPVEGVPQSCLLPPSI